MRPAWPRPRRRGCCAPVAAHPWRRRRFAAGRAGRGLLRAARASAPTGTDFLDAAVGGRRRRARRPRAAGVDACRASATTGHATRRRRGRRRRAALRPRRPPGGTASSRSSWASPARWPRPPPRSRSPRCWPTRWSVLRNEGNQNNEVGLPLTLLRLRPEHEAAVLEMGLYVHGRHRPPVPPSRGRPSASSPRCAASTSSRAGSLEAIERGQARAAWRRCRPDGTAVLNADDPRVAAHGTATAARVLTLRLRRGGRRDGADDVARWASPGCASGCACRTAAVEVDDAALGRHCVHNALAAAAVAPAPGPDAGDHRRRPRAAVRARPTARTLIEPARWRILDDSYNAVARLDGRGARPAGRRCPGAAWRSWARCSSWATRRAAEHHRVGGPRAAGVADRLIVVGAGAAGIADGRPRRRHGPAAPCDTRRPTATPRSPCCCADCATGDTILRQGLPRRGARPARRAARAGGAAAGGARRA